VAQDLVLNRATAKALRAKREGFITGFNPFEEV
jgi:hypothetical protein